MALMIVWIIFFIPAALIYYYRCQWQCQSCKGTDIAGTKQRSKGGGGDLPPAAGKGGGPGGPASPAAPAPTATPAREMRKDAMTTPPPAA